MKNEWLQYAVLRTASFLAPGEQRAVWLEEWRSELWYVPRRRATPFCLGAFRDALWLRRNPLNLVTRPLITMDSPLQCLTLLAALAAVGIFFAVRLEGAPNLMLPSAYGTPARGWIALILLSAAITLMMRDYGAYRPPMLWASKLRRWIFLALKVALVLSIMLCGLVVVGSIGLLPLASNGFIPACILAFRWVLTDQRRRCPVCLRLLTNPVRIGSPSQMFLEWYGTESMCSQGHGLLYVREASTSCYSKQQWLRLGGSWSALFSKAAAVRPG